MVSHKREGTTRANRPRYRAGGFFRAAKAAVLCHHRHSVTAVVVPTVWHPTFTRIEERPMGDSSEEARARAEAKFQKQQQAHQQAAAAKAEREVQARAADANTARLKSLRLTKEAADKAAEVKTKTDAPAKTKSAATKKKPSP